MEWPVGMLVRPLPCEEGWEDECPSYVEEMLDDVGKLMTVTSRSLTGHAVLDNGYVYMDNWIVPADNVEEE